MDTLIELLEKELKQLDTAWNETESEEEAFFISGEMVAYKKVLAILKEV